ncbi:LSM_domain-containing protein [Hexamita inflata]|uniref:LSM domain-containing protein n=1 Tax=Hexamita inflata TaxID=28002 RepID=A0AA86NKE7_9EUKA|nr:LSM domain-containing protein [Hexamita inflata]
MDKPQELLKACQHTAVLVKLNNGSQIFGVLRNMDAYYNLNLSDCQVINELGDISSVNQMKINGTFVQSIRLSDQSVQQVEQKVKQQQIPQQTVEVSNITVTVDKPKPKFSLTK